MDVASSPPTTSTSHDPPRQDPPAPAPVPAPAPPPPPPAPMNHHRRHNRYSPSTSTHPPSPHVIINARRRRSSNHSRAQPTMNHSASPPAVASSSHPPHSRHHSRSPSPSGGQDHDRMDTDEESSQSHSERDSQSPEVDAGPTTNSVHHIMDIEHVLMDTTPDMPVTIEMPPPPTSNSLPNGTHIATIHVDLNAVVQGSSLGSTGPPPDSWPSGVPPPPAEIQIAAADAMLDSGILRQELDEARRQTEPQEGERSRRDQEDDDEDGSDSDESMDEADNPYWASFAPDTSSPDEGELASIEEAGEVDATNHKHWEASAFEALDDPEYVARDVGRITWTVDNNHGTPEKPNRKPIMRSPSVRIGDLYWNIKYFPRGNDGTDYMSVYIECASKPYEEAEEEDARKADAEMEGSVVQDGEEAKQDHDTIVKDSAADLQDTPIVNGDSDHTKAEPTAQEPEMLVELEPEPAWAAAAQVACVVYNPQEPRVHAHQQSSHQYYNGNPDWGWTRFHGPWSEIHTRRRGQRKPLLQNDTLEFTAYIRIFDDHTRSLWWHPSDSHPVWDSNSLLGLRGLKCRETSSSAFVAAFSAWMHLTCVTKEIASADVPDRSSVSAPYLKPVIKELQEIYFKEALESSSSDINIGAIASVLGYFYGSEIDLKKDVVIVWETLRRVFNLEHNLNLDVKSAHDMLEEIMMLKQPDPFKETDIKDAYPIQRRDAVWLEANHEPASVQEALDHTSIHGGKAFKVWGNIGNRDNDMTPSILQIELHRQKYDVDARKWKKLTHKISLDENVICNGHEFSLYGIIVHRGGLDYSDYYSVLRPEGPGARWVKYAGDGTSRSVEVLTTKAAIQNHEGGDNAGESAAVAYIVMYVRTDRVSQILSPAMKRELLSESRKRKSDQLTASEEKDDASTPDSFQIGHRLWRTATPVSCGKVYDSIRETNHLSRVFYRTEQRQRQKEFPKPEPEPESENVKIEEAKPEANGEDPKPESSGDTKSPEPAAQEILGYLRLFDAEAQVLSDAREFASTDNANILQTLKDVLGIEGEEPWSFYFQQGLTIRSKHLVKRSATFLDISHGDNVWDGMLFIGQRHPSSTEITGLEASGKCATPIEYSQYLLGEYHPALRSSHLSNHYFTFAYLFVPLSHGRPHGEGTHIALSGSSYHGPFRCGRKAGLNGTMRYANGDTYVGEWSADEPDGQGTMTYAKTGNVYTGGWRKRRRHGKGEMKYNVADEEMMQCQVCYEKDMDAVFCFCGHVVACEECARRVEFCPVCREVVKRVVVLKGPLGSSGNAGVGSWGGGAEGGGGMGIIP